ncbi:BrnA antitoxin family protein [Aquamicrobium sp. LC103]|uniref:BrnA antitoxin family protein n=1 Tax=Aquamicrobium sp. LC103 TaxID=1120658 RepID=UPI00063E91F5|nr:BrnA antitoxin family protein [Aquamicrobium sp. LC103]TKT78406.1 BrnA antitoxin family protein [Aquamicrobium sp. LC103]
MTIKFSSKRPLTDKEEAEIQKMIVSDPDNPEITDEQAKQGKPFKEALPELFESIQRSRGRPRVDNPKEAVTLRLDPETLAAFKATGKDWRAKMVQALDEAAHNDNWLNTDHKKA